MKKLWYWIWFSSAWYWTNTVTGEKKDSTTFFKVVNLVSILFCIIALFVIFVSSK